MNAFFFFLVFATGSAGFLPLHPRQYMWGWRMRAKEEAAQKEREAAAVAAATAAATEQVDLSKSDS